MVKIAVEEEPAAYEPDHYLADNNTREPMNWRQSKM
jgi:hypothetical protein